MFKTKIHATIKLIRIKNWIKNGLILIPLIFSGLFLNYNINQYVNTVIGLLAFCFASSVVYIINDIIDKQNDMHDEIKKNRPIAAGIIKTHEAITLTAVLYIIMTLLLLYNSISIYCVVIINSYILLNIIYSIKLKNMPIIDISVLSCFFLIRLIYGSILCDAPVSGYLYLTTITAAYYFGIGKRLKELNKNNLKIRNVLKHYSSEFLTGIHNAFLCMTMLSYSLWAINYNLGIINNKCILISAFIVIIIMLYYHYIISDPENKTGNPVDILLKNKALLFLCIIYAVIIIIGIIKH